MTSCSERFFDSQRSLLSSVNIFDHSVFKAYQFMQSVITFRLWCGARGTQLRHRHPLYSNGSDIGVVSMLVAPFLAPPTQIRWFHQCRHQGVFQRLLPSRKIKPPLPWNILLWSSSLRYSYPISPTSSRWTLCWNSGTRRASHCFTFFVTVPKGDFIDSFDQTHTWFVTMTSGLFFFADFTRGIERSLHPAVISFPPIN